MNKDKIEKCPICQRPLIKGPSINEHHLIPKAEKGKDTVLIHVICHSKIHSIWHENELRDYYHTIERIISDERMSKFIKWVQKKEPEFMDKNKLTNTRRKKGR